MQGRPGGVDEAITTLGPADESLGLYDGFLGDGTLQNVRGSVTDLCRAVALDSVPSSGYDT